MPVVASASRNESPVVTVTWAWCRTRSLTAARFRCEVVAPNKLQRPAGDRVKTEDAKDAFDLAQLLRLDEFTPVAVPTVEQETACALVRARERLSR